MKNALTAILIASLFGCAMTPAQIREQGKQTKFAMRLSPAAAARCVARNTENAGTSLNTTVREADIPGQIELLIFDHDNTFYVIADFKPDEGGSIATVWVTRYAIDSAQDRLLNRFQGC